MIGTRKTRPSASRLRANASEPVEVCVPAQKSSDDEEASNRKDEGYSSPVEREPITLSSSPQKVYRMVDEMPSPTSPGKQHQVYKVVLTGGPCGGKTTGMDRLFNFFENMGWKVFTVPETATILLGSKVKFAELSPVAAYVFQKDILKTMVQIEQTVFNQAALVTGKNVLVICDRGAMDPSAYMPKDEWLKMLAELNLSEFDLLNTRYNQIVHMVTAAEGASKYYTVANNATRSEGIEAALKQDELTRNVWLGHPYYDIVDNSECSSFEDKVIKALQIVCDRVGVKNTRDRLNKNSRKRKWLVVAIDESRFPKSENYFIQHNYLLSDSNMCQVRIRSRRHINNRGESYSLTTRVFHQDTRQCVETRNNITHREYNRYLAMNDKSRTTLYKTRRIFMVGSQYFNLDIYMDPLPAAANGKHLMFLETYTTQPKGSDLPELPDFLTVQREITGETEYSMYSLAKIPGAKCERDEFVGAANYDE